MDEMPGDEEANGEDLEGPPVDEEEPQDANEEDLDAADGAEQAGDEDTGGAGAGSDDEAGGDDLEELRAMEEALGEHEEAAEDAPAPEKRREGSAASRPLKSTAGKGGAIGAPIGGRSMGKLAKSSKGSSPSHFD